MADATGILTPGFTGTGTDTLELFLKVFSGEVLTTFERMARLRPRVRRRVLRSGKVAQFPALGKVTATYHTRGVNIISPDAGQLLSDVDFGEQLIHIDKKLVAPVMLDELDELMQHYDDRQEVSTEIGRALATTDDQQLIQVALLAAQATAGPTSDHPIGAALFESNMESDITRFKKAIRVGSQILDENDVPDMDRALLLRPNIYNGLIDDGEFIDRDFSGEGSIAAGMIRRAFNAELVKSNNIPSTDITTDPNQHSGSPNQNVYSGNFTNALAILIQRSAIGTAQLQGVRTSVSWKDEYQGWFLLGKQAVGHGPLRPGAAIGIFKGTGAELTNATDIDTFSP